MRQKENLSYPLGDKFFAKIRKTTAPPSVLIIRLMVGLVFCSEGLQKFLFPAELGVGRFEKIGIPFSGWTAPLVGSIEMICGSLLILGLLTRLVTIPLLGVILVAIATTKVPLLFEKGFWGMAHEGRTDFSMLMGLLFLLIVGAGAWSLDTRR